ncbi:MAG: DUF1549 domain-containing protein [Verrucomicrobiota bacterium]
MLPTAAALFAFALFSSRIASDAAALAAVDYNRDIRPVLSDACYACHGPDHDKRKAGLRLDRREDALKALKSGAFAIVPGEPARSELVHRISATDPDEIMPPGKSGKKLSAAQIDLIRRWVQEGAKWTGHWAYQKPETPPLPPLKNTSWPRNEIDHFILARLESENLKPSPEADKPRLIRRVSLDLTGLPPTVAEVESFLYDNSPEAYDKLVDRLLKSPHYGERMAQDWLDLARYADSQGYHHDSHRDLWPWRDWVIQAFNRNMPFDQFTKEQLAGDLLPNPTREQRIATGFHRNEMTTSEGGAMPEEYAVKYVAGRVDTTARVWLGTSLACAECHDHKYDPISQKDYYQFFAYFNTIGENGLDQDLNPVPRLSLDTPEQRQKLEQFGKEIAALTKAHQAMVEMPNEEQASAQAAWEAKHRHGVIESWQPLEAGKLASTHETTLSKRPDGTIVASGPNPEKETFEITLRTDRQKLTGLRLEALPSEDDSSLAKAGRSANGDFLLSGVELVARSANPQMASPLPRPEFGSWYALGPFKASSAREAYDKTFGPESGVDLGKSFDEGKLKWTEHTDWSGDEPHELTEGISATYLFRTIRAAEPGWARLSFGSDDGLQVWWNGRKVLASDSTRAVAPDQDKSVVWLASGENKLLLKVSNSGGRSGFYFKLLAEPVLEHPVEFAAAAADFSQPERHVRGVLDDKADSGWGVGGDKPEARGPHQALFQASHPARSREEPSRAAVEVRVGQASVQPGPLPTVRHHGRSIAGEFVVLPDAACNHSLRAPPMLSAGQKAEMQRYYRETFVPEVIELTNAEAQKKAKQDEQQYHRHHGRCRRWRSCARRSYSCAAISSSTAKR